MLPAPFCSTLLSLQLGKKSDKNIYNEREKKLKIVEKQLFSIFFLFCLSAFLFFGCFSSFHMLFFFFCSFSTYISENCPQWWATNKQTKKNIQSYQLALHSLREVLGMEWRVIVRTVGWTQKGGRRRRKKVNKVHEGGESSKSSRRQRMAAQLTVRKHSPHHRTGAVRVSACVVWMLNDNKKNHH